jgi:hypothetical protein
MNYSIRLLGRRGRACSHRPEASGLPKPPYKLASLFDVSMPGGAYPGEDSKPLGLSLLHGKLASETVGLIDKGIARLSDPGMSTFFAQYGNLPVALKILRRLRKAAQDHLDYTWDIH